LKFGLTPSFLTIVCIFMTFFYYIEDLRNAGITGMGITILEAGYAFSHILAVIGMGSWAVK